METLTYEQRCTLYRALLVAFEGMYEKKRPYAIKHGYLYPDTGFCLAIQGLSKILFGVYVSLGAPDSGAFLKRVVPELHAILPKTWDGFGHLYRGNAQLFYRLKLLRKLMQALNDQKWPFEQGQPTPIADNGGGAASAIIC